MSKFHEMLEPNHPSSTPNKITIKIPSTHTHEDFIERPKEDWVNNSAGKCFLYKNKTLSLIPKLMHKS